MDGAVSEVEGLAEVLKKKEWTAADARKVMAAQKASGMTIVGFARKHGFTAQRIHRWKGKLGPDGAPATPVGAFLPVRVLPPRPPAVAGLEVVVAGGRSIRIGADFDGGLLQRVVAALEGTPC